MKNTLPSLTLAGIGVTVLLLAAGLHANSPQSTAPAATPQTQFAADRMIAQSLAQLAKFDSISAKIRQQVDLQGHELLGDGIYLQSISGRDVLLRMELKVQVADQLCSSLQVSDGRDLWIEETRCSDRTVQRIDVRQVASALRKFRPRIEELGGGRMPLGGLPEWLHSLSVNFQFAHAGDTELSGVPVSMLVGHWRKDRLLEMLPKQKEQIKAGQLADLSQLPDHIPQEVVLLLGHDDFFPYLIDYRSYDAATATSAAKARSLLRVQIYEVRTGGPVDLRQFVYQPGQVDVTDATRDTAKLIGQRGRRQIAAMNIANSSNLE